VLDTLALRTLRSFQRVDALGRCLDFTLGMRGEIAPSKDPFRRWIRVDLAILAIVVLYDVPTPFTRLDNGTTGSSIEATACFFHKNAVHTRFNRDTFHCFVWSFLCWTQMQPLPGHKIIPWEAVRSQSSAEESLSW
jgi:hypothetical protein